MPSLRREGLRSGASARGPLLLARSVLRYRCISLAGVEAVDRVGALQAQLSAWQPFDDALYLVDLTGDNAQVFALEQKRLTALKAVPAQLWPESICCAPRADGHYLVEGLEGVEGQAWLSGLLQASRWWPAAPELAEWQAFVRQSRGDVAAQAVPAVLRNDFERPPRAIVRSEHLGRAAMGQQRLLLVAVSLVLVGFTSMSARGAWEAFDTRNKTREAVQSLRQEVAPLLAARDKALAAADQSAALVSQMQAAQPLELIEELSRLLPKGSLLREFDLSQRTLRIAVELPAEVSRAKLISDLESGGWFTKVSEIKDGVARNNGVSLEMQLSSFSATRATSADAGLKRLATEPVAPPPRLLEMPTPSSGKQGQK